MIVRIHEGLPNSGTVSAGPASYSRWVDEAKPGDQLRLAQRDAKRQHGTARLSDEESWPLGTGTRLCEPSRDEIHLTRPRRAIPDR
jgi:hypothetical protein